MDPPFPLADLAWTPSLVRVHALVDAALACSEPVLLVGDTGSGKTSACQLAAALRGCPLVTINCSRHTEASDFVGGFRPVRQEGRWEGLCRGARAGAAAPTKTLLISGPNYPRAALSCRTGLKWPAQRFGCRVYQLPAPPLKGLGVKSLGNT